MRTTFAMVATLATLLGGVAIAEEQGAEVDEANAPPMVLKSCAADGECDDGDPKTHDFCQRFMNDQDQADTRCVHEPVRHECRANSDCDDQDPATRDTCLRSVGDLGEPEARCLHEASTGGCRSNAECDDGDPATRDYCQHFLAAAQREARCIHDLAVSGCRTDRDCDDTDACTRDLCVRGVNESGEMVSSCSHLGDDACAVR